MCGGRLHIAYTCSRTSNRDAANCPQLANRRLCDSWRIASSFETTRPSSLTVGIKTSPLSVPKLIDRTVLTLPSGFLHVWARKQIDMFRRCARDERRLVLVLGTSLGRLLLLRGLGRLFPLLPPEAHLLESAQKLLCVRQCWPLQGWFRGAHLAFQGYHVPSFCQAHLFSRTVAWRCSMWIEFKSSSSTLLPRASA